MRVSPIVLFSSMGLNGVRMKRESTTPGAFRRMALALVCVLFCAAGAVSARAYSAAQFAAIHAQMTNDLAALDALENPNRSERAFFRALKRGTNALNKVSTADGRMLRTLNVLLARKPGYAPSLAIVASNLVVGFNAQHDFVGDLLLELPASKESDEVKALYLKLAPSVARLNGALTIARISALYDPAMTRLASVLIRANQALIIPFPSDLGTDSVVARINGVNFRSSAGAATGTPFEAVATETNIVMTLGALVNTGTGPRGIFLSVPNVQFGAFRYAIPDVASFTNRTAVYSEQETNVGATNGAVFVSTTGTEVYGTFSCSGPGFTVIDGRFRITISSQP